MSKTHKEAIFVRSQENMRSMTIDISIAMN